MDTQVASRVSALQELPRALTGLRDALELEESLASRETLLYLDAELLFPPAKLQSLDETRMRELRRLFGAALSLSVEYDDEVIVADGSHGVSPAEYKSLLRTIDADEKLTLRFVLDKAKLLDQLGLRAELPDLQTQRLFVYLFADRLPYLLSRELSCCEDDLWGENSQAQVVILVCDEDIWLTGDYLAICGGTHLSHWKESLRSAPAEPISDTGVCASKMNALCLDNVRWDKPWVRHLTPLHFKCEQRNGGGSSSLSRVLALQEARLSLLYSADRTLELQNRVWSVYQGNQTPIRIAWPSVESEARQQRARVGYESAARRLTALVEWIYEPTWPIDRLLMTQLYLANELRACESERSFDFLLDNVGRIEGDLRSRWKDFIGKKLDGFSEQERAFEDDVAKATQAFGDQIAGLIKGLVESGLAAAAAVIGSFLASFFAKPFEGLVFAWGLRIYAGYVFIFPLLLALTHSWGQFQVNRREFAARRARIEERLDAQKVAAILQNSQVETNETRFKRWLGAAVAIYVLLIVCALLAAHYLPPLIHPAP